MEDIEELQIEDEVEEDEVPIEYDIATYPSDFTLSGIHKMWGMGILRYQSFSVNLCGQSNNHLCSLSHFC